MLGERAGNPGVLLVVSSLALFGCRKEERGVPPARASTAAERPTSAVTEEWPHLTLRITKVHRSRSPSHTPPFHQPGGDWTYFDAVLVSDPVATVTVGVTNGRIAGKALGSSKAVLVPSNAEAGRRFVAAFARAFRVPEPRPPRPERATLKPLLLDSAVLGTNLGRDAGGSFSGRGSWQATKWFFDQAGTESEVFFNYSLDEGLAEFAEKDEEYNKDVAAALALVLRDGTPR